nr:hypothetical protein [Candidatus Sigynarchaeota archaeon]
MRKHNHALVGRNVVLVLVACFFGFLVLLEKDNHREINLNPTNIVASDAVIFRDFTVTATNIPTTNCSIVVNATGIEIMNGTEAFMYSRSDLVDGGFITARADNFSDGILDPSWHVINPSNAIISESGVSLSMTDTGLHGWGGLPFKTDAPAITQHVWGDTGAQIMLDTSSLVNAGEQGGFLYLFDDDFLKFYYSRSGLNGSEGLLHAMIAENGACRTLFDVTTLHGQWVNISFIRSGDDFSFFLGIPAGPSIEIGNATLLFPLDGDVGLFASGGATCVF